MCARVCHASTTGSQALRARWGTKPPPAQRGLLRSGFSRCAASRPVLAAPAPVRPRERGLPESEVRNSTPTPTACMRCKANPSPCTASASMSLRWPSRVKAAPTPLLHSVAPLTEAIAPAHEDQSGEGKNTLPRVCPSLKMRFYEKILAGMEVRLRFFAASR